MPAPDPRKFPVGKLAMLLNSTPLGTVVTAARLKKHREQAGFAISSDGVTLDVLKYTAWLCFRRHQRTSPAAGRGAFAEVVEREQADVAAVLKGVEKP